VYETQRNVVRVHVLIEAALRRPFLGPSNPLANRAHVSPVFPVSEHPVIIADGGNLIRRKVSLKGWR
jgi:hypothetical protein